MHFTKAVVIVFLCLNKWAAFAQQTFELKDIFTQPYVVWYGIDYTHCKFVGTFTGKDLNVYFHGWNRLILEEPHKYDIGKFVQKYDVFNEVESVEKLNEATTPRTTHFSSDSTLSKTLLSQMVQRYKGKRSEGIGLVLIADRYDRNKNYASHYAVFFDIASGKVLISQRYKTPPAGGGIRNYWANSILQALELLSKNYRGRWKKKYSDAH